MSQPANSFLLEFAGGSLVCRFGFANPARLFGLRSQLHRFLLQPRCDDRLHVLQHPERSEQLRGHRRDQNDEHCNVPSRNPGHNSRILAHLLHHRESAQSDEFGRQHLKLRPHRSHHNFQRGKKMHSFYDFLLDHLLHLCGHRHSYRAEYGWRCVWSKVICLYLY